MARPGEEGALGRKGRHARGRDRSALIVGTSTEFLGRNPLPLVVRQRPVLLVLGEPGTGKTSVARRVVGQQAVRLRAEALHDACTRAVRRGRWPDELLLADGLILDGPTYLNRRPGVVRLLNALLLRRCEGGRPTVVCQGSGDVTASLLLDAVDPEHRATLTLRFPIGQGQKRFAVKICNQLGLPPAVGRQLDVSAPWTYRKVIRALRAMQRDPDATSG